MKFTQAFTSLGLFAGALAAPALESTRGPQTANFLFQCEGDSSYKMGIVVDGETFKTGKLTSQMYTSLYIHLIC